MVSAQGAFGLVMLGELAQEDGTVVPCACKTLKSQNPDDFDALVAEAMLVAQFDHENVVQRGALLTQTPQVICLVLNVGDQCMGSVYKDPK